MTNRIEKWVRRGGPAIVLGLALVACDVNNLLEVPDPDVATPASVSTKAALPAVLAGAIGDFMRAYNGTGDFNMVTQGGLMSDELVWAETFPTRFEVDARSIQISNGSTETTFRDLHRARVSAVRAADGYGRLDPGSIAQWAEALNLEGMTYILFGEDYCNGVPFSTFNADGSQTFGQPLTNAQMFQEAVVRFDSALKVLGTSTAATAVAQQNFAKIGKGRALLDLDQGAQSVAAVNGVPTNFTYRIAHSQNTARQNNGTYNIVYDGRRFGVGQAEGGVGLTFRADGDTAGAILDPRVRNGRGQGNLSTGFDGVTALFVEKKYPARDSAIVVINGTEARLIEAEIDMRAAGATWVGTLNTLRTGIGMAGNLADPGTQAAREDLFFKERAYWLFLTAHRLGDLRRLVRQYGRAVNAVYPNGTYFKGGTYGTDVNFPIPFDEKNNPEYKPAQCLDRNP